MARSQIVLRSEFDTERLGAILAANLPDQIVLGLVGTLGVGKTRLVKAIATAAGVDPEHVQSPTYVLCHEYRGRVGISHWDTYRLASTAEFLDLGIEDYWSSPGWTIIEWADRVRDVLPDERIELRIMLGDTSPCDTEVREVEFTTPDASLWPWIARVVSQYDLGAKVT